MARDPSTQEVALGSWTEGAPCGTTLCRVHVAYAPALLHDVLHLVENVLELKVLLDELSGRRFPVDGRNQVDLEP
jgi:hypothetical protein